MRHDFAGDGTTPEHWPLEKLMPFANNPRTHSDSQDARLAWTLLKVMVDANSPASVKVRAAAAKGIENEDPEARILELGRAAESSEVREVRVESGEHDTKAQRVGQQFNLYGRFTGIFIPEVLVRSPIISAGAKLTYGRLARYAGEDGKCYPAMASLAAEIGMGERQAQKYVAELVRQNLVRRRHRFSGGAQNSNSYEFLWHEVFERAGGERSFTGGNATTPGG